MTYPLTEKQKEMADCADSHSYAGTQEKFGIGRNQVKYLRGKRNRIEREKEADNGEAIRPAMAFIDADLGMHRIADRKTAGLGSPVRQGKRSPESVHSAPGSFPLYDGHVIYLG